MLSFFVLVPKDNYSGDTIKAVCIFRGMFVRFICAHVQGFFDAKIMCSSNAQCNNEGKVGVNLAGVRSCVTTVPELYLTLCTI